MGFVANATGFIQSANQGVTDARDFVDDRVATLLSPFGTKGISGWEVDVPTEEAVELSAEITDHYTEDGTYINDHIVSAPVRVTLTGLVGELTYSTPPRVFGQFSSLNSRLGDIPGYEPELVAGAIQASRDVVQTAERVASEINAELARAQNLAAAFSGDLQNASRQSRVIQDLRSLWGTKAIVSVQTPWAFYETMAIESIRLTQGERTTQETTVEVVCKQIRFAAVRRVTFDNSLTAPANDIQEAAGDPENVGRAQATTTPLFDLTGGER